MTLGGSRFPGALGAMLIEILPFLRGIASDIQNNLGDDSPALVPNVMFAYALTSFLIGFLFIALGTCKAGKLVAYFPSTVLTGVIGGIGVSLFILGLGLPVPPSSPSLTLGNTRSILFSSDHIALLSASCVPAIFLSISLRSEILRRCTFGKTQHPYYVPLYFLLIPIIFWIVVAGLHKADDKGMDTLVEAGWLFRLQDTSKQAEIGRSWIYWSLFDFSKLKLHALKAAVTNIVLLVVIGVLNLPVYVPALGSSLGVPIKMDHEFLGQGVANILAGFAGTVPNILQLSYSVFFTRAGGGRLEAGIVTVLTFSFFLVSSKVIPYVPTILASIVVLFLGIELTSEAVWESTKQLQFSEWLVVMATLIGCTFVGFAPGFGIGLGAAIVVYVVWGVVDTKARSISIDEEFGGFGPKSHNRKRYFSEDKEPDVSSWQASENSSETPITLKQCVTARYLSRLSVITLSGHAFFATIPSIKARIKSSTNVSDLYQFIVIDLTNVCRLETSVAEALNREAHEKIDERALVFSGFSLDSPVYADLRRGGLQANFGAQKIIQFQVELIENQSLAFENCTDAVEWCKYQIDHDILVSDTDTKVSLEEGSHDIVYAEDIVLKRKDLPQIQRLFQYLFLSGSERVWRDQSLDPSDVVAHLSNQGVAIRCYKPGELLKAKGDSVARAVFIVQGRIALEELSLSTRRYESRKPFREVLNGFLVKILSLFTPNNSARAIPERSDKLVSRILSTDQSFVTLGDMVRINSSEVPWVHCDQMTALSRKPCWTIEVSLSEMDDPWPSLEEWGLDAVLVD